MILQALVREYEKLLQQDKLDKPGWSSTKVSYSLDIDLDGNLFAVESLLLPVTLTNKKGKAKTTLITQSMNLPTQVKRAFGLAANFLCDNSAYFLGIDGKGKPERTIKCFHTAQQLHHILLDEVDSDAAKAICCFFDHWEPGKAAEHPALKDQLDAILKGGNLIFNVDDDYAHELPEIRAAWQRYYNQVADVPVMQCLVTGENAPIALLHPSLQGIWGAKSTGASLVSFNARAYESYGHSGDQGLNAPVSQYAAFAYGAALNYLLKDRERVQRIGDTTVVCWASSGEIAYQNLMQQSLNDDELQGVIKKLAHGERADLDGITLDPEEPFYILGLSPNAARASVRFFLQNSFGEFMKNIDAHYARLEIQCPEFASGKRSIWGLLQETVNKKSTNKDPKPQLAGDLLRAVLTGGRYPETLLQGVELRIRAEKVINWRRAAILKAFLIRNYGEITQYQEVMTVKLNEDSNYIPYVLGRIFSQYEGIQQWANPGINTTIRDRYFNSAAATPAIVFGALGKLCQNHLRKLSKGARVTCEKQLMELFNKLDEPIPARLTLQEQSVFQIGYYHETQKRFTKKEEN